RRLALCVVEVRGDRDNRVADRLAEEGLGVRAQLLEDHAADLGRGVLRALDGDAGVAVLALLARVGDDRHLLGDLVPLASHETLYREDCGLAGRHLPPRSR